MVNDIEAEIKRIQSKKEEVIGIFETERKQHIKKQIKEIRSKTGKRKLKRRKRPPLVFKQKKGRLKRFERDQEASNRLIGGIVGTPKKKVNILG